MGSGIVILGVIIVGALLIGLLEYGLESFLGRFFKIKSSGSGYAVLKMFQLPVQIILSVLFFLPLLVCLFYILVKGTFPQFPLLEIGYVICASLFCVYLVCLLCFAPLRSCSFRSTSSFDSSRHQIFKLIAFTIIVVVFLIGMMCYELFMA